MYIKVDSSNPLIWRWQIDRPERANGLGITLAAELDAALRNLETNVAQAQSPRCLIITAAPRQGRSGKTWIGGGDLKELAALQSKEEGGAYGSMLAGICRRLEALPAVVIAAIDGRAIGGGAEFALAADLRLGTKAAAFEFRQLRIGLTTGYGGARRLVELIGKAHASRLIWTAAEVNADAALRLGLLTEVCETTTDLANRAVALATTIASLEPMAIAVQKRLLAACRLAGDDTQLALEEKWFGELWLNPTHKQMLSDFNTKS